MIPPHTEPIECFVRDIWDISHSFAFHTPYRAYRALYILNWIYRYFTEPHYVHWIGKSNTTLFPFLYLNEGVHANLHANTHSSLFCASYGLMATCFVLDGSVIAAWISGLVQTLLYADFFYYYFQRYNYLIISKLQSYSDLCMKLTHSIVLFFSWKNNVKLQLPAWTEFCMSSAGQEFQEALIINVLI